MKKIIYFLLAIILLGFVLILTCPDRNDHLDALENKLAMEFSEDSTENDNVLSSLGSLFTVGLGNMMLENSLSVENYFMFSVGKMKVDGEEYVFSIGFLNHVFVLE